MNSAAMEAKIRTLYEADQAERTVGWEQIDWETLRANDAHRLAQAKQIYRLFTDIDVELSGEALYQLGLLFQHSPAVEDLLLARRCGELSGTKGYTDGDWLAAAAEDRYLLATTGVQKWGTQFYKTEAGAWEQRPMLSDAESGVTDEQRAAKGVPPRSRQLAVFRARTDI